eukprot:9852424-Alexandrium_andersonii.AAC.1
MVALIEARLAGDTNYIVGQVLYLMASSLQSGETGRGSRIGSGREGPRQADPGASFSSEQLAV